MGYAERRGNYWRARFKEAPGKYGTVRDANGATVRFGGKREAEQAANDAEAKVRAGAWRDPMLGSETFGQFANRWYAIQDLAPSTMQNYRHHLEEHLLPAFGEEPIREMSAAGIAAWQKRELAAGYAASSVKSWRSTLHLVLEDAIDEGLRDSNPAAVRRGRGRRAGRSSRRAPEKAITNALGLLLIAERAALLSGRDDEFVAVNLKGYTGIRWGELVGLEVSYVRPAAVRIEWQLYELDTAELIRCPPKDDSYRDIDMPAFLSALMSGHLARTNPQPCRCHGRRYVFSGHRATKGGARLESATMLDVARRAGVAIGTVSNVLNGSEVVREATRIQVQDAMRDLGYVRGAQLTELAAHWRRSGFSAWLFKPAATGLYPRRAPRPARPVPLLAEPWPGVPVRGRGALGRAEACWVPIAPGLTPHGLRHTHKTMMEELRVPTKLMDERMGHEDGSVQARYSHVTADMRRDLVAGLTELWTAALHRRQALAPGSPVAVLDDLLKAL